MNRYVLALLLLPGCAGLETSGYLGPNVNHDENTTHVTAGGRVQTFHDLGGGVEVGYGGDVSHYWSQVGRGGDNVATLALTPMATVRYRRGQFEPYASVGPAFQVSHGDESGFSVGPDLRLGIGYRIPLKAEEGDGARSGLVFAEWRTTWSDVDAEWVLPLASPSRSGGHGRGRGRKRGGFPPPRLQEEEIGWTSHFLVGFGVEW